MIPGAGLDAKLQHLCTCVLIGGRGFTGVAEGTELRSCTWISPGAHHGGAHGDFIKAGKTSEARRKGRRVRPTALQRLEGCCSCPGEDRGSPTEP